MCLSFAEAGHTEEGLVRVDGHDPWDDRTCYSDLTAVADKLEEDFSVVEELGDDDFTSSINLARSIFLIRHMHDTMSLYI